MAHEIEVPQGGLWEYDQWTIVIDWEGTLKYSGLKCPHKIDTGKDDIHTRYDGSTFSMGRIYRVPLVAVLKNEGGYNTTGLCLHCAMAALPEEGEVEQLKAYLEKDN